MIYFWVVMAYMGGLVGLGLYKSRSVKNQNDFMVAGRKVPTILLVGTLVSTWIGSGSIIAGAGLAYRRGISELWGSVGAWAAIVLVYFLAGRVRRIAQYTVPDILEKRYNKWARILGTVTIIIAYTTIVGYQFKGGGMVLDLVAGIPMKYGVIFTAVFIILYTSMAGMISIVTLDIFNGTIILIGILIAVPFLLHGVGGIQHVLTTLPADHFKVFGHENAVWAMGVAFPVFFLLLGESSMYQKFFSAKNEKAARTAVVGWIAGTIVIETMICFLSIIASSYFTHLKDSETVILYTARHGQEAGLPLFAGVMLLGAAVAIIVSTGNSFLLTPSTNITRDIYQRFINPNAGGKHLVWLQRFWVVILGIMAYLLLTQFKTVLEMAYTAYTMIGAGLTPAILAAFLWKRVTAAGGVASILGGMLGTLVAKFGFGVGWDYLIFPPIILSVVLLIVVSLLTPPSPEEKWKPFMEKQEAGPIR